MWSLGDSPPNPLLANRERPVRALMQVRPKWAADLVGRYHPLVPVLAPNGQRVPNVWARLGTRRTRQSRSARVPICRLVRRLDDELVVVLVEGHSELVEEALRP